MYGTHNSEVIEKLNRLAELEDKIEQGLMVELPKKCYEVVGVLGIDIIEYDITSIVHDYDTNKISAIWCKNKNSRLYFSSKDIGKDIFLTKAEAEKQLKELKEDKI